MSVCTDVFDINGADRKAVVMYNLKHISIASLVLVFTTPVSNAADIIDPPYVEVVPEVTHIESSGGWYLRGDLGYAHMSVTHVDKQLSYIDSGSGDLVYSRDNFSSASLNEAWLLSGGIGYQVNSTLRFDGTVKHVFDADFKGDSSTSGSGYLCSVLDGIADANANICNSVDTTTFSATIAMANAYADLGTFAGFTPYMGAGIGGAYTHWGDLNNDTQCNSAGGCTNGSVNYQTDFDGIHGHKNGWRFAYSAHAGASYDLTRNMKIDAGYTFTHISGGDMYGFAGGAGVQGHHGAIKIHEVRAGLRYSFK